MTSSLKLTLGTALLVAFSSAPAPGADLSSLQKAYFAGTKPGSWARYEQTTTDAKGKVQKSVMTFSRLANEGDRTWLEIRTEPKEGSKAKPTTMKYLMNLDFKVEKNALDYVKHIDRLILQEDGKEAMEYPPDMLQTVLGALAVSVDYGADVTSLGGGSEGGTPCDRYSMNGSFDVKMAFIRMKGTTESDICLSEKVPFGRVAEATVTKDEKGKQTMRSEMKLLETGTGATSRITGPVKKIEMPKMPWGS